MQSLRERYQCCLLVPLLLHIQVPLHSLACSPSIWVSGLTPSLTDPANNFKVEPKSSSALLCSRSSLATSQTLVPQPRIFVLRPTMPLLTRPCEEPTDAPFTLVH